MKILVIGPSWVGDMMMSHSLYRTLKVKYPLSKIDVMGDTCFTPLLKRMPEVRHVIPMPFGHGVIDIKKRRHLGHALRSNQYDHAYVLPNSFKSALIPFFANIPQRTGWLGEMRYGLLNNIFCINKAVFPLMIQRYIVLAYNKDCIQCIDDLPQPLLFPKLEVNSEEIVQIMTMFNLKNYRPMIGFCPWAKFGSAKCWPYYHYARLAINLIKQGYQIMLFGLAKDYSDGERIRDILQKEARNHCINLAGQTHLEQVIVLIASCQLIVSNDSGLMHIAAALNKPLIALYGPSSPEFTPPLSNKAKVIRLISGYQKVRKGKVNYDYHQSLIDIKPQQVLETIIPLLSDISKQ